MNKQESKFKKGYLTCLADLEKFIDEFEIEIWGDKVIYSDTLIEDFINNKKKAR